MLLQQVAQSDPALKARLQNIQSERVNAVEAATSPVQVAAADKNAFKAYDQEVQQVIDAYEKAGTKGMHNLVEGAKNTLKDGGFGALRGADAVGLGVLFADTLGGQARALAEVSQAFKKAKDNATTPQEVAGAERQYNEAVGEIATGAYIKAGGFVFICKVIGNKVVLTAIGRASITAAAAGAGWLGMDMAAGAGVATYLGGTLSATTFATVGAVVVSSVGLYFTMESLNNPETWDNIFYMWDHPRETLNANLYIYSHAFRVLFDQRTWSDIPDKLEAIKSTPWSVWHQAIQHILNGSHLTNLAEQQVFGEEMRMEVPYFVRDPNGNGEPPGSTDNRDGDQVGSGNNAGQDSRGGDRRGGRNNNRIGRPARSTDNRDGDRRGSGRGGNRGGGRNNNAQPGGSASSGVNIPSPQLPNLPPQIPEQQPPSPPDPIGWRPPNSGPISNLPGFAPQQPQPQNPAPVSKPPGSAPQQPARQNPDPISKAPDDSYSSWLDSMKGERWTDNMRRETREILREAFKDTWADLPLGEDSKNWIYDEASKEWSPIDCCKWKLNDFGQWLPAEGAFKVPDGNQASSPPASSGGHTGAVPITRMRPIRGVPTSERLEARVP